MYRIWNTVNKKMIQDEGFRRVIIKDNSYWLIEIGLDDVRLIDTQQNCGIVMCSTLQYDRYSVEIYEHDIIELQWYDFKRDLIFEYGYGIVYYDNAWKILGENGVVVNLIENMENKDYRVMRKIVGNVFQEFWDKNKLIKRKWGYSIPTRISEIFVEHTPSIRPNSFY